MTGIPASRRFLIWFLLAEAVLSLAIYREALWGKALLAPLDCGPALMSKFRYADPDNRGVPSNHYIIDLFTYNLPTQYTLYHAYREGKVPWWDPYTYAGRPLLADTPVNGTDPIRLACYALLPFELAYNWTQILYSLLTGVGMLLLLRRWEVREPIAVFLALAYQYSAYFALALHMPALQPPLAWFPFLWLAWDSWWRKPNAWSLPIGALVVALIFYTGNLQTDAYLVLFAMAFLLGYGGRSLSQWRKLLPIIALSGIVGAMLAAPVLSMQLEFFAQNVRPVGSGFKRMGLLSGAVSLLTAIYPWFLGTFRTLDASKFFGQTALSYHLYIGSAGVVLSILGVCRAPANPERRPAWRTALWLGAIFLFVASSPLLAFLYMRLAGLAVLGLVILAAFGTEYLWEQVKPFPRLGWAMLVFTCGTIAALQVAAFVVYPKLRPAVQRFMEKRVASSTIDQATALRNFQLQNLPHEISVQNPETLLAALSLTSLALVCLFPATRRHRLVLSSVLVLNLLPELHFYIRFLPNQSSELWHRMLAGGPEQNKIRALLGDKSLRLYEISPGIHEMALPHQWGHVYHVRMVNGYTSLQPASLFVMSEAEKARYRAQLADYIYESSERGQAAGTLKTNALPGSVLFQWLTPTIRHFKSQPVSLCEVRLDFADGPAGSLLWTDTFYPGWRAQDGSTTLPLTRAEPCFSRLEIPAGARTVWLRYEPRYLRLSLWITLLGVLALPGAWWFTRQKPVPELVLPGRSLVSQ